MIQIIIKYYKNIYYSLAVREYLVTVLYLLLSINLLFGFNSSKKEKTDLCQKIKYTYENKRRNAI